MKRLILLICLLLMPLSVVAQTTGGDIPIGIYNPLGVNGWQNGDLIFYNNGVFNRLAIGASTNVLTSNGTIPGWAAGGGSSIGSIGLQWDNVLYPTAFPNSPLTASGTLGPPVLKSQTAYTVFGNNTGIAAAPAFNTMTLGATAPLTVTNSGNLIQGTTVALTTPLSIANGGIGAATAPANTIFSNTTGGTAAPAFNSLSIATGTGLTGGGNVTVNPTISLVTPVSLANGGTGQTSSTAAFNALSPMTTAGDLLFENATPTVARLGIGTAGFVLTSVSGLPAWAILPGANVSSATGTLPIGNGGTGQTTASPAFNALSPVTTAGDLIIGTGTNAAGRLGIGTSGFLLTSNGTTASWVANAATSDPYGTVVAWWATDSTIPNGWALCNGQTTNWITGPHAGNSVTLPNLIGMFIQGGDITGGSSTANVNGFGSQANQSQFGAITHTHTYSGTTGTASLQSNGGATVNTSTNAAHTHTFSGTTSSTSNQVACYSIVYIMKL